jgi:hypothetical protein
VGDPREMFEYLGGPLTGSPAVGFVPGASGDPSEWVPKLLPMFAHAVVYADGEDYWVPAQTRALSTTE